MTLHFMSTKSPDSIQECYYAKLFGVTHCLTVNKKDYIFACLQKYLLTQCMDLTKTHRRSLDVHLHLINAGSHPHSRWLPQPAKLKQQKNGDESVLQILGYDLCGSS